LLAHAARDGAEAPAEPAELVIREVGSRVVSDRIQPAVEGLVHGCVVDVGHINDHGSHDIVEVHLLMIFFFIIHDLTISVDADQNLLGLDHPVHHDQTEALENGRINIVVAETHHVFLELFVDIFSEKVPEFKADLEELSFITFGVLNHVSQPLLGAIFEHDGVFVLWL
jgi:hypothetical protein